MTKVSASRRKSTQVHASPGQTESQVDPSFQLASAYDSVWPGLYNISKCSNNELSARTDTILHPGTVMIKPCYTSITNRTMFRSDRFP